MKKALGFYSDVLGAKVERRLDEFGLVQLRAGESIIDLVDVGAAWLKAEGARPFTPEVRNVDHICIRVDPFDEAAIERHLVMNRIEIIERGQRYGAQGNGPSVYVRDPFGTVVELKGQATPIESDEPVIKTARLVLRPVRMADAAVLLPTFTDSEAMRYWSHGPISTLRDMQGIIAQFAAAESRGRIVCDHARRRPRHRLREFFTSSDAMSGMGYIMRRAAWGKGFVAEAVGGALGHGFTRLNLHRIWLEIDPRNTASIRIAEKCGFVREGFARKSFFMNGEYQDSVFYAMLYEDWITRTGAGGPSGR
jgi:RimJ/RimL family protein N-acetyltransferase/catechol 2,3-dioxygenase-like lactoylglutathione lyase family enzyme